MKAGLIAVYRPEQRESVLRLAALEQAILGLGWESEWIDYRPAGAASKEEERSGGVPLRVSGHSFSSFRELEGAVLPYDMLLFCGGVWQQDDPVCFGAFSSLRKAAYAAVLRDQDTEKLSRYLPDFSHLSAVGQSARHVLQAASGRAVPAVLDPLALLRPEEWDALVPPGKAPGAPYLYWDCAGSGGALAPYVRALSQRLGLSVLHPRSASAAELVEGIRRAGWVCTDTPEGVALALAFRKPFFVSVPTAQLLYPETSPVFDLLRPLGLEGRIVGQGGTDAPDAPIDYDTVSPRLAQLQKGSLACLRAALEGSAAEAENAVEPLETVPRLAPAQSCTGCSACASICPKDAISMLRGIDGFSYPAIDNEKCVQCGRCTSVCPLMRPRPAAPLPAAFAAWNRDDAIRKDSTSGGAFTALAGYILEGGGVVFGAAMDGRQHLRHIACFRKEDLWRLRGAKYVQSDLGDVFREIKTLLKTRAVLFSGTPCQVDGLYHYLGGQPENLTTCDIVCHGVPSPGVWEDMARSIEARQGKGLQAVRFRNKVTGWKNSHFTAVYDDGTVDTSPLFSTEYGHAFGKALFLRQSCHRCAYTNLNRPGDFTLGDLWGLRDDEFTAQQQLGISLLLVNTPHASHIFDKLPLSRQVFPVERAVAGNPRLASPIQAPPERAAFFAAYALEPFDQVRKAYFALPPLPLRMLSRLLSPEVKDKLRKTLHR